MDWGIYTFSIVSEPIVIARAGHQALLKLQGVLSTEDISTQIICPPGEDPGKG